MKALDIWSKILPENHPDFAVKYVNIGVQYYQLEDKEKSIIYFKWAYKICSQSQCCDISRSTDWIKKLEPQCGTTCLEQSTCLVGDIQQQLNDMASSS